MNERMSRMLGGRKRRVLAGATCAVAAAGTLAVTALAVHDEDFQLDGDVSAATVTNVGGHQQKVDWDSLFTSAGEVKAQAPDFPFTGSHFTKDFKTANGKFVTSDDSTFATGSKDTLPISGWQCNRDNNVNNKIDIANAYASTYQNGPDGDKILYFGLERAYNGGDANVGFWFMQGKVGCESTGAATNFTGQHSDGDLLIVSAFTGGGKVSNVVVYEWKIPAGQTVGALDPSPVFQSDPNDPNGADCKTVQGLDTACATVNTGTINTPWQTYSSTKNFGLGTKLPVASFFEGGLNLSKINLEDKCFNSFLGDTRSSQSTTATLFDYAGGTTGSCTSAITTTPKTGAGDDVPAGGLDIPTDPADAAISVTDSANLAVSGVDSFTGTVKFRLCGPLADTNATCADAQGNPTGVLVSTEDVTQSGTVVSDAATVTEAGRYCWSAEFSGDADAGVPADFDHAATECFVVNPAQPTISTQATSGPVDFGSTITDTATLNGTAHKPGTGANGSINPTTLGDDATGTITFKAYGPDDATCTGDPAYTATVNVSGDGSSYSPAGFVPTQPGTYRWIATYTGDLPNTLAVAGHCNDANESTVVRQIPTKIKTEQSWFPNDTATVTAGEGNLADGGSVKFELFNNMDCSGSAVYTETVPLAGGASSREVSTSNGPSKAGKFEITTGYVDAADSEKTPFSWKVTYTVADADKAHTGRQSECRVEHFTVKYTNDAGDGVKFP